MFCRSSSLLARRMLFRPSLLDKALQQHREVPQPTIIASLSAPSFRSLALAFSMSSLSNGTSKPNKLSETDLLRQPFPSYLEQIKMFPSGVKALWNDIKTYRYIEDAASTKNNGWPNGTKPRRQQAFQRKLLKELRNVAIPVVGYVAIPVAGNAFVVLAIAFPKVFLSWHFLTMSQVRSFASDEHWFRIYYHKELAQCFWSTISTGRGYINPTSMQNFLDIVDNDAAGPVYKDIGPLLDLFAPGTSGLNDLDKLPDHHLLTLARSSDLLRPPFDISSFLLNFVPSSWTATQLNKIAKSIVIDDHLLMRERHNTNDCASLTAEEVIDACLIRGLPTNGALSIDEMRQCLTNHLHMTSQIPPTADTDQIRSFLMHLPAIRESMRRT